ncbi:BspA family leucine-rich repeat surface protein [Campylobacter sp. 2018MI13]|nr:BspA family leucine-rich repeat surface protein [Campylobacter sp. 2018MI13]
MKYNTKTKEELQALVNDLSISLGDIDTSAIADIGILFKYTKKDFSAISSWNVSNVTDMIIMFVYFKIENDTSKHSKRFSNY